MNDLKQVIKRQQHHLNKEIAAIVKQTATQSSYHALSRQDKRTVEFHHDRLKQEQFLQKDCKKAERIARRIALILEKLRKDFHNIKQFLNNYNFVNTVGMDSNCGGACDSDLSTDSGTRQAWKRELENMLTMVWHYVDSQYLGDYALLHIPASAPSASESNCHSNISAYNCCPKQYRPYFHYYTPAGDCLTFPPAVGQHSGDSTNTIPSGHNNNKEYSPYSYKGQKSTVSAGEGKDAPGSHRHFQVCNKDFEIRQLWNLIVGSTGGETVDRDAWWSFHVANAIIAVTNDPTITLATTAEGSNSLQSYFETVVCLPTAMSTILAEDNLDTNGASYQNVYAILLSLANGSAAASPGGASKTQAQNESDTYADKANRDSTTSDSGAFDEALKNAPTICHVEDETDLQFIIKLVVMVMNDIRSCQINNDRELQVIEYVSEVAECNEAFHKDVFTDMTAIDESELGQKYEIGKELVKDLNNLYKENCVTKQTLLGDSIFS
jgi:hypothetical protein